jgi:hypothetical protein
VVLGLGPVNDEGRPRSGTSAKGGQPRPSSLYTKPRETDNPQLQQ